MADNKTLAFANEETAGKFVPSVEKDTMVHVPGKYSGMLSSIPSDVAEGMVKRGSNLLTTKDTKPPAAKEKDK